MKPDEMKNVDFQIAAQNYSTPYWKQGNKLMICILLIPQLFFGNIISFSLISPDRLCNKHLKYERKIYNKENIICQ